MAKRAPQQEQVTQTEAIDLSGLETGAELNPALQAIYAEMGQDEFGKIKVYIYKLEEESGKEPRVWEGPPGDYDLMAVARRFGSGDYRVKLYVPHDSGRIVIGGNQIFPILLDPAEDAKIVALRNGQLNPAQPAVQAVQPQITADTIALAITTALKSAMPAPVDPLEQMTKLAGVMQKLMPAPVVAPTGNSFMETLAAARSLMELTKGFAPPVDAEGRADVKGQAMLRGVDVLTRMFEKSLEQAKPNPNAVQAEKSVTVAPLENAQSQEIAPELSAEQLEELEMLRLQIKMVNREAKANSDVDKLVEDFYDELPDAIFDLIVLEPKWFEVLCTNVPECAKYKEWYEKMRTAIIAKGMKEGDLKSNADGSLSFVEEDDTTGPVAATQ